MLRSNSRWLVLADDLSGAAEAAAALVSVRTPTVLLLDPDSPGGGGDADVLVVDLDDRHLPPVVAGSRVRRALRLLTSGSAARRCLLKVDSLLRGPLPARLRVLQESGGVVIAPALPSMRRVVHDGIVSVDGVPLAATAAWAVEGHRAPESVPAALAPLTTAVVDLGTVRSPSLTDVLATALRRGVVPVCDGETDGDLDAVVAAVNALPDELAGVALAGSAGLAAAVGRTWSAEPDLPPASSSAVGPLLVIGTADPGAAVQVEKLVATGVPEVRVCRSLLADAAHLAPLAERVAEQLATGPVVLRPDGAEPVDPSLSRELASRLGALVASAVGLCGGPVNLALTGGETARRVLEALGIDRLIPLGQIHLGAVLSRRTDGGLVVTRPGSFGDADSLITITAAMRPVGLAAPWMTTPSLEGTTKGGA